MKVLFLFLDQEFLGSLSSAHLDVCHMSVVLELSKSDLVIGEVVVELTLRLDVLVGDDAVAEVFILAEFNPLVAAESQDEVNKVQNWLDSDENCVLGHINAQNDVNPNVWFNSAVNCCVLRHDVLKFHLADDVRGVAKNGAFDDPLYGREGRQTPVLADLLQAAEAKDAVDHVVDTEPQSLALDFAPESEVGEQVVVDDVEHREHHADNQQDEALQFQVFDFVLLLL